MLLIVVGPSGVGKSTLCGHLLDTFDELTLSVSYTTRAPRGQEEDGVHYHFVTPEAFEAMVLAGAFAEHAAVHGNAYGTAKQTIDAALAEGRSLLFDIDYQGAMQLLEHYPAAVSVMLLPPSMQVLEARLRGRGTDADEVIRRRLENARHEMAQFRHFKHIVFNNDLELAKADMRAIYRAGRTAMTQQAEAVMRLLDE